MAADGSTEPGVRPDARSEADEWRRAGITDDSLDREAIDLDLVRFDLEGSVRGADHRLACWRYAPRARVIWLRPAKGQCLVDDYELGVVAGANLNGVAGTRGHYRQADRWVGGTGARE